MKRLLDPIVDPNKLNHAQLVTLVEKQQVEISAQQQELNNYERSKKANKEATNQWLKENNDLKAANSEQHVLMSTLRDTNLQQTTDLQQHQRLTADQEKLIREQSTELTAAREKVQTLRQSLQEESAQVVTLQGLYDSRRTVAWYLSRQQHSSRRIFQH